MIGTVSIKREAPAAVPQNREPKMGALASVAERGFPVAVALLVTGFIGLFVTIGADSRWLAALGHVIANRGSIPRGVPFATEPTSHWANTLVLAQLCFHALESSFADRGLVVADLVCVVAGLSILAYDARAAGARTGAVTTAVVLAALGSIPALAVVRVQMFSLVLFPALVALLRAEQRRPSHRIWLALPLLALWSNLHGAALSGLALLYAYLALSRFRHQRLTAVAVALGALVAVCVTPAGTATISYYHGLLTNVAAQQGVGQWSPLGSNPFDWVMICAAIILAFRLRRGVPPLWEIAVLVGLAALSIKAGRDGVWLLFFLVGPASHAGGKIKRWEPLAPVLAVMGILLIAIDIANPPHPSGISARMVQQGVRSAAGETILADGLPAEQVALAGGRIWAGNPLDAFSHRVQTEYVDFIQGYPSGRDALASPAVRWVLVTRGSGAATLVAADRQYTLYGSDSTALLYRRAR